MLWSTGFIGSRLGVPFAEPFMLTSIRMALVVVILLVIAVVVRAPWPRDWATITHIAVAGLLVHATYLSGVLYAITWKVPLGFVALIAGMQPVLTALISRLLFDEHLRGIQWIGMGLGLAGVLIFVTSHYTLVDASLAGLTAAMIALLGITCGTLYQKRFCQNMDLRTGGVIQFAATGVVSFFLAMAFESGHVVWVPQFIFAIFWLAIVLSLGAISLLYILIRQGSAAKVASLFFLTPSVTAILAYLLFQESISWLAFAGLAVSASGVMLVTKTNV